MPSPSRTTRPPEKIQISPPGRIRVDVLRAWYKHHQEEMDEVRKWLSKDIKARRGIERIVEELIRTSASEATGKAVELGIREVKFGVNLEKAAQVAYKRLAEASMEAVENVTPRNILVAFEMMLRDVGYEVQGHHLEVKIRVPTQEELDEERALLLQKRREAEEEAQRAQRIENERRLEIETSNEEPIEEGEIGEEEIDDENRSIDEFEEGQEHEDSIADEASDGEPEPEPEPEPVHEAPGSGRGGRGKKPKS